jgi:tetratricopeptide (TPR) repeat protein
MVAYEIILRRRLRARDVAAVVPLLVCGAIAAWLNLHDNPSHGVAYHGGSLWVTLRTSATTVPAYLFNIIAPFQLATYYPVPLRASWLDPPVATAVATILLLATLTVEFARRGRPEAFWLVWFAATLAPMLNLVPFPALMNDRYLYLPLLGILVPLLRLIRRWLEGAGVDRAAPFLAGATVAVLAMLTVARIPVFHDELALWADFALRYSYISADRPYGAAPRREEKRLLNDALARHPTRAALANNLGAFAFEENRIGDAIPLLERARALDRNDYVIPLNLGRAYLFAGRIAEAVTTLREATVLEPPSFFAHLNLARALLKRGDVAGARAALTHAQAIKRDPFFWDAVERQVTRAEQQRS